MTNQISTIIIDSEAQSNELLKLYLQELDYINLVGSYASFEEGYNAVTTVKPSVVIIDMSGSVDACIETINKISANNQDSKIIVISSNYSTDDIVKTMRAGARDFLPKPLIKTALFESLEKVRELIFGITTENKKCRVISTFSNKGGIGKTTIAMNLALELANITKEKVALVDLNLQLGDVTTFLDINPPFNISYLIKNLPKIDESFLLSSMEKYNDTSLYILAEPPFLESTDTLNATQINTLFDALKQTFSYIVVDPGANFDEKTITALDNSDLILLVTIVNLPAIRNCQRCLNLFERLGYEKEKTKIVLNRYMENDEIKMEDIEHVIEQKVYWKIPNNYFTIMSAINKGLPVGTVNPDSNVAQSYKELAATLSDNIYKQNFAKKMSRNGFLNLANLFK